MTDNPWEGLDAEARKVVDEAFWGTPFVINDRLRARLMHLMWSYGRGLLEASTHRRVNPTALEAMSDQDLAEIRERMRALGFDLDDDALVAGTFALVDTALTVAGKRTDQVENEELRTMLEAMVATAMVGELAVRRFKDRIKEG